MVNENLPTNDEWASVKREGSVQPVGVGDASVSAELLQAIINAAREALPNEGWTWKTAAKCRGRSFTPTLRRPRCRRPRTWGSRISPTRST